MGRRHSAIVPSSVRLGDLLERTTISFRTLAGLVSPGGVLLLAAWALQREEPVRNVIEPYAIYFCFAALALAALLSWYHNYSLVLCVAAVVGLTAWNSIGLSGGPAIPRLIPALLLPINFALFAWLQERGLVTASGFMKLVAILAQVAGVLFVTRSGEWGMSLVNGIPAGEWTWMPWQGSLWFLAAGLFLVLLAFRRRTKAEPALLWALAAVFAGLNQDRTEIAFLYTGVAGLILMLGVLEHGYDIAYLDELTGLPSRRAFNEAHRLLRGRYSIAMCDADQFKKLNDTYGHDVGDQVLKMIASRLANVRGGGRVFRYGGEEFAILFRGRTAAEVGPIVESLRDEVAGTEFVLRGPLRVAKKPEQIPNPDPRPSVRITISIGFADRSKRNPTPELVLKAADAALYLAKESGRNCVKLAEAPVSQETA